MMMACIHCIGNELIFTVEDTSAKNPKDRYRSYKIDCDKFMEVPVSKEIIDSDRMRLSDKDKKFSSL
jgi:hypothetical protein